MQTTGTGRHRGWSVPVGYQLLEICTNSLLHTQIGMWLLNTAGYWQNCRCPPVNRAHTGTTSTGWKAACDLIPFKFPKIYADCKT